MKMNKGRMAGILGALIVHLTAGIIFMVIKIGTLNEKASSEILLEFDQPVDEIPLQKVPGVTTSGGEYSYGTDEQLDAQISNIARNIASQGDEKININDYIDKVKEELIQSGKLGTDNYIDAQKRNGSTSDIGETSVNIVSDIPDSDKTYESEKMASQFSGPTRIYYDLPGRYHTYLPIPIYKCEGSGVVILTIEVSQTGSVLNASVISAESTTSDECLVETAVSSAKNSRFNPDINEEKVQVGTLTYHFVAQ
jgi:hypothetical protein